MAVTHSRSLARYATRAAFTQEATDATASALNDALAVDVATKTDIKLLDTKLTAMEGKLTLLIWVVGINVAATITTLVKHW